MKLIELLYKGSSLLEQAGVDNARGEAFMLLKYVYNIDDNEWPLLSVQCHEETAQYMELIRRRQAGEPVQYIIGHAYFYGYKFYVSQGVLIPRFDTETLVSEAITEAKKKKPAKVLDMCAGSGCIGLTVALEVKSAEVTLSDIEKVCLETIEKNAKALGAQNITVMESNLFLCIDGLFDIIAVNPPYISKVEFENLSREVAHYEPKIALYGGSDGLTFYRRIADEISEHLKKDGLILLEIGYEQAEAVTEILQNKGFTNIKTIIDIAGRDRVISARNVNCF